MTVLLDQFVETLAQTRLMTAGDVQAFLDGLPADENPKTGEDLTKLLVRRDKLTLEERGGGQPLLPRGGSGRAARPYQQRKRG